MTSFLIAVDNGHSNVKTYSKYGAKIWPSGIKLASDSAWEKEVSRHGGTLPEGFYVVNGKRVLFGESAIRSGLQIIKLENRYLADSLYGTSVAIAIYESLSPKNKNASVYEVDLVGAYPSTSYQYIDEIKDAVTAQGSNVWVIDGQYGQKTIYVNSVHLFDEPFGGYALANYTHQMNFGTYKPNNKRKPIEAVSIVIDLGGGTTGMVRLNGIKPDWDTAVSLNVGLNNVHAELFDRLKGLHKDAMRGDPTTWRPRITELIKTGQFNLGQSVVDYSELRNAVANQVLMNEVRARYQDMTGQASNYVILTGGGTAVLSTLIQEQLNRTGVFLSDEPKKIVLANARGLYLLGGGTYGK